MDYKRRSMQSVPFSTTHTLLLLVSIEIAMLPLCSTHHIPDHPMFHFPLAVLLRIHPYLWYLRFISVSGCTSDGWKRGGGQFAIYLLVSIIRRQRLSSMAWRSCKHVIRSWNSLQVLCVRLHSRARLCSCFIWLDFSAGGRWILQCKIGY